MYACRVRDTGAGWNPTNGISQGGAHLQTRSQCVTDFTAAFSGTPATRSLWTHPDAWLLMISPPLDSLYQLYNSPLPRKECRCVNPTQTPGGDGGACVGVYSPFVCRPPYLLHSMCVAIVLQYCTWLPVHFVLCTPV